MVLSHVRCCGLHLRCVLVCARHLQVESLQILAEYGADVRARDDVGRTALHWAAEKGQVEVVFALAELGALVNAADDTGSSPLHLAARKGQVEVLLVLQVRILRVLEDYARCCCCETVRLCRRKFLLRPLCALWPRSPFALNAVSGLLRLARSDRVQERQIFL